MPEMSCAEAIVECMVREQVKKVFCVPGESYLPLLDVLYDSDIDVISNRHEGGAAFMAEGYAKATNETAVVLATRGVGASNLSIGIHTAFQDSTPMVVFLGQVQSNFKGREGFQEMELDRFLSEMTKWGVELLQSERTPELIQRAFRTAVSGRPGPVVVSLPEDVLPQVAEMTFAPPSAAPKPTLTKEQGIDVFRHINSAERPVIIAGGGIKAANAESSLKKLAEQTGIPVVSSFRRQDVFPNNHELYCGHLGLGSPSQQVETVKKADVILAIGSRLSEVTTQDYTIITSDHTLIHIDIDTNSIGKVFPPVLGIAADAKNACDALIEECREVDVKRWISWKTERREAFEKSSRLEDVREEKVSIGYKEIMSIFNELKPKDCFVTNDAGNFAAWLHNFHTFTAEKSFAGPTSGAMGYGFPAAIGAKLALPKKPVVSFSGDGGFMMTMQEIETAVRCKVAVIALVFNNATYGTIRMHQEKIYPDRVIGTRFGEVNFSKIADAMGAVGVRAESAVEFRKAFQKALQETERPVIIEMKMNPKQLSPTMILSE
ncbi:thiamine pyrophosphate-dependent enzyme [Alteribacillus sp. HJP-4]|uniref:thiamine pyrophosphate-dependent enzyme n=1 Tax=Alteribacillus sp. HJP-4 TaxID=2775394 RepID=UPI0035CD29A0